MHLQYFKTFLALTEDRGFTRAARRLGMTQPGVSQHLKSLEEHYGVQLVIRGRKTLELTEAGERLKRHALKLFSEMNDFREKVRTDDPHLGTCRLASPGSFGMKMYSFLLQLQSQHPGLCMHYEYRPNPTVLSELLEDRLDMGFVSKEPMDPRLDVKIIDHERLCLVVPAKQKDFSFEGLRRLGFINHPDGFHHASRLLELNFPAQFRSMNDLPIRGFNNQITRIPEPVALGLGFTALPEYAARAFTQQKRIKILRLPKPVIDPIYRVTRRGRPLPSRFAFIEKSYLASINKPDRP